MLKVNDWEEHQSYRRDRPPPPWIKVHRRVFMSRKWAMLSDSEKGQLVSIWILAADRDGMIPDDANVIRKMAGLDDTPNIQKFIDLGLMTPDGRQDDVNVTSVGAKSDAPEAEAKAKAKAKAKADTEREGRTRKRAQQLPYEDLPEDFRAYAQEKRPDLDPDKVWENFRDYYLGHGKPMKDWKRTWQRWVRNEMGNKARKPAPPPAVDIYQGEDGNWYRLDPVTLKDVRVPDPNAINGNVIDGQARRIERD